MAAASDHRVQHGLDSSLVAARVDCSWLANATMPIAKRLLGIAPERRMPRYAKRTFRQQFAKRTPARQGNTVLLWPDTFNNYFHPDTAMAAVDVLESAGYRVSIPRKPLCCGRPLYDWGFLDLAKKQLETIIDELLPFVDAGTAIIGLEPSCISVFRDELHNLFPGRTIPMMTLSEFIQQQGDRFRMPRLQRKAIVQEPLPSQGDQVRAGGSRAPQARTGFRPSRFGMLRMAGASASRRSTTTSRCASAARPSAARARGVGRHPLIRRRLQLPRADRAVDRPSRAPPRRSLADGVGVAGVSSGGRCENVHSRTALPHRPRYAR
jgi:hypothetical protein